MKHLLTVGTIAMACLFTACEKSDGTDNLSAQDRNFVNEMALSNRTEISLSNLALARATDPSVRMYAEMMVADHTTADAELLNIADDLDIRVTTDSLNPMGAAMRATLETLSGRSFDSAYITGQVPGHQLSLTIAQNEAANGINPQLKNFAAAKIPVITMHLNMADTMSVRFR